MPHQDQLNNSIRERHVEAGLKKMLDKYAKFRNTSDPGELANFKMHCHETYSLVPIQLPVLVVPPQVNEPKETLFKIPSKSPVKQTRQVSKCFLCKRLCLDNKALRTKQLQMRHDHCVKVKYIYI